MKPRLAATAALAGALVSLSVAAQPVAVSLGQAPVDGLKAAYLHCDRVTSRARVDPSTFAMCMAVGDELLKRGFAGDFDKLLAWWRAEKARDGRPEAFATAP